jgi:hypothetical protein
MSGPPPTCDYAWYLILSCIGHVIARCRILMVQRPAMRVDLLSVEERAETLRDQMKEAVRGGQSDLLPLDFKQRVYDAQEAITRQLGTAEMTPLQAIGTEDTLIQELILAAKADYPTPGFKS